MRRRKEEREEGDEWWPSASTRLPSLYSIHRWKGRRETVTGVVRRRFLDLHQTISAMGAGASSLPDFLDKEACIAAGGDFFTEALWEANKKDDKISRDDFLRLGTLIAVCEVAPKGNSCTGAEPEGDVKGTVKFEQIFGTPPCKITYEITGLSPGLHGFHMYV